MFACTLRNTALFQYIATSKARSKVKWSYSHPIWVLGSQRSLTTWIMPQGIYRNRLLLFTCRHYKFQQFLLSFGLVINYMCRGWPCLASMICTNQHQWPSQAKRDIVSYLCGMWIIEQQTCVHIGVPSTSYVNCILLAEVSSLLSRWRPQLHFPDYPILSTQTGQYEEQLVLAGWTTKTEILVASLQELQLHYMQRPKQRRRPSYMQILLHKCVEKFQRSHTHCFPGKPVSLPSSLGRLALEVKRFGGKINTFTFYCSVCFFLFKRSLFTHTSMTVDFSPQLLHPGRWSEFSLYTVLRDN